MADPPIPEPTPEELEAAGVEIVTAEVERVSFVDRGAIRGEPATDVKIELGDGTKFRERVEVVESGAGLTFSFSNALLDADDAVALDEDGAARIVPPEARHELQIDGIAAGQMTVEQIESAKLQARETAAAKAKAYFDGMDRLREAFAGRTVRRGG